MKITIIYQYYQDHSSAGHSLVYELTQFLAEQGHDVTVISGQMGYMQRKTPTLSWYKRIITREQYGKVKVVRTYTYPELHRNYLGRFLSYISFSLSCVIGFLTPDKPDVVLASSPPIFPMFSAWLICKLRGIPFVIEVRDLWPASAVQMGILKNRQLIGIMAWMESVLYNQSVKIVALTEGIRDNICTRGWQKDKVDVISCGVDFEKLYPDALGGALIRDKYGWQDKKIVLYFGALGEANNLHVTLRAAKRLQKRQEILFIFIGDGMKRDEINNALTEFELNNVLLLPPVPKDEARLYINAADLCLVTLKDIPLFGGAIPTKLIDYMACGKAVLCGVRGEAERIVNDAGAGAIFEPDDDHQLSELLLELLGNKTRAEEMGLRAFNYVQRRFSLPALHQHMEKLLLGVAGGVQSADFPDNLKSY